MKKFFSIGEMSKIKGITIKALRHYDKIGLLKPEYVNPSNGYRYYSLEQFIYLDIIKITRNSDISLNDLKIIFDKKDIKLLLNFLDLYKNLAIKKISELNDQIDNIENLHNILKYSINSIKDEKINIKYIEERFIFTRNYTNINTESLDMMLEYSELYSEINKNNLINTYETGIIYNFDNDYNIFPKQIFATVEAKDKCKALSLSTIPKGKYICLSYTKDTSEKVGKKLLDYITKNKLTPKLILEINLLDNIFSIDNYSCEYQILF